MVTTSGGRTGVFVAPEHAAAIADLGALVAAVRTERGFSPQEFAALAAISTADLAALEAGDAGTTLAVLHAVAEALDMSAGELLAGPPPHPQAQTQRPRAAAPAAPRMPEPAPAPQYVFVADAAARAEHVATVPVAPEPVAPLTPVVTPAGARAGRQQPSRTYVTRVAEAQAPAPRRTHGVPRTFADLRVGVLAERVFPTLPHFAVAAVTEAGHAISVVARIFRVPAWKLEGWVRDGVAEPPAARTRQWT